MSTLDDGSIQPLTPDQADRFAAQIRPIWEMTEDEFRAASIPRAPVAGSSTAPDTIIDAIPMVAVEGDMSPHTPVPAEPVAKAAPAAPAPLRPVAAGPTRMGLGATAVMDATDDAASPALQPFPPADGTPAADAGTTQLSAKDPVAVGAAAPAVEAPTAVLAAVPAVAEAPPDAGIPAADRPPPSSRRGRQVSSGAAVSSGVAPARLSVARPSAADEPVLIPVSGGSSGILKIAAVLVGIGGLVVGAVLLMGGDDKPKADADRDKSAADAPKKDDGAAAKAADPAPPAPPPPTAKADEPKPDDAKPDEPKDDAKPDEPKDDGKGSQASGGSKPPPSGGSKPPPSGGKPSGGNKPGGGTSIIRDAPF